jgi:hypothetical protein
MVHHLLGAALEQIAVAPHRLLERIHHLRKNQVLRRNHVVQVVSQRLLKHIPLRLPILLATATSSLQSLASISGAILLVVDGMVLPLNC